MKRPIGELFLLGGICFFASWTVLCYAIVISGSSFQDLVTWWPLSIVSGLFFTWLCVKAAIPTAIPPRSQQSRLTTPDRIAGVRAWIPMLLVASLTALRLAEVPYWAFWIVFLMASTMVLYWVYITDEYHVLLSPPPNNGRGRIGLFALVLLGATLAAITHRPDIDDTLYLNFVVSSLDFPFDSLYSHSGLWLDKGVPLEMPLYRFHSYELLVAAISHVLNVEHKVIYYLVLPCFFGGAAIIVHLRLAQYLLPGRSLAFLVVWLVLIIALGESHRSFGNFAFVRLFQGKAVLVTVMLPLCLLLGLRFAEIPDWRRGLALSMAAISSLGLSSSALITVPVVLVAVLTGGMLNAPRTVARRIAAGGLASSVILIGIGVFLTTRMTIGQGVYGETLPSTENGLSIVMGDGILGALLLSLFPIAPLFVADRARRKIYAGTSMLYVLAVLNPWSAPFVAEMFDLALQWRLFWSVPLAISASIALVGLVTLQSRGLPVYLQHVYLPLVLLALLLASKQWSISTENNVTVSLPAYKVENFDHSLASEIVQTSHPGSNVYVPVTIAAWIPTFRHHPYPAYIRPDYFLFESILTHVGDDELNRRRRLFDILEGHDVHASTPAFFMDQLVHDRPSHVVYKSDIRMAPKLAAVLIDAGYTSDIRGEYLLWRLQ